MMSFKNKLYNIKDSLTNESKQDVYKRCVQFKMNRNMNTYNKNIENICHYLLSRSTIKVLKTMEREEARVELKKRREALENGEDY